MNFTTVKIATSVPPADAPKLRAALGKAGAGKIGNYTFCSFSVVGTGRSVPNDQADPHIGEANEMATIQEELVEVTCERAKAKHVIEVLRAVHPYEEPVVEITPLLDENEL
jgi:hypothetical protein